MAWLVALLLVPVAGVPIYVMFGRSWHAFGRKSKLNRLFEGPGWASARSG